MTDSNVELVFDEYVRKPFVVEAVEVTRENIEEIAKYIGDLGEKDDGTPFIIVNRRTIPSVYRVYPGYFMTKMGDNIRCYSRKIFRQQFVESSVEIQQWVDYMNGETEDESPQSDIEESA